MDYCFPFSIRDLNVRFGPKPETNNRRQLPSDSTPEIPSKLAVIFFKKASNKLSWPQPFKSLLATINDWKQRNEPNPHKKKAPRTAPKETE